MIAKVFSCPVNYLFTFLTVFLDAQKIFNFDDVQGITFSFVACVWVSYIKKMSNLRLRKFTVMFSFNIFIVLTLIIRSLIHFELLFV